MYPPLMQLETPNRKKQLNSHGERHSISFSSRSIETDSADLNQKERFAMEVERLKEV